MATKKKKKTEESLVDTILKNVKGIELASSDVFKFDRIPFHIPQLDKLTGGGIPKKRFTLLTGQPSGGKSYLAMKAVQSVQKAGGTAAWIDTEMSIDAEWMERCGVDKDALLASQPLSGEDAFRIIMALLEAGVDLVVLDSIAGLVPEAELEDFDKNPLGWLARFVNDKLARLMASGGLRTGKDGAAFIAVNQQRSSVGPVAIKAMPGGLGQNFWNHMMLEVRRAGWLEDKKSKIKEGFDMEITLKKTKVGAEHWQKTIVPFKVDGGIDLMESYMREGMAKGYIEQAGPWYSFEGERVMGLNSLKALLTDTPALGDRLKGLVDGTQSPAAETGNDGAGTEDSQLLN
jgi:recombination protein RecA